VSAGQVAPGLSTPCGPSAARDGRIRLLQEADPTLGDTVQEVAHRWGFASPSRFAAHFRAAFGVTPKWVLDH
jgi:AraC-like DNA-binding protein